MTTTEQVGLDALKKLKEITKSIKDSKEIEWPEPMTAEAEQERREFLHDQVRQSIEGKQR